MTRMLASLENVSKRYDNGQIIALQDVSLQIKKGDFIAIVGPSGSGKSTLLHVLSGLDRPDSGKIFFEGREQGSLGEWSKIRAKRIGFVFQAFFLFPTLTVSENIEVPMFGVEPRHFLRRQRVKELLHNVKLANRANHLPRQLSGGERQRVAIARALANSPDLVLADEPTGSLDSKTSAEILDLLTEMRQDNGVTLVIVTHEQMIADRADRALAILDGRITITTENQPAS